jgi:hypothetical protein
VAWKSSQHVQANLLSSSAINHQEGEIMATTKKPSTTTAALSPAVLGPIQSRIGPIFDPAWLKLIDERVLGDIIAVQLDALTEQLEVEKRSITKIKTLVAGAKR